MRVSKSRFCTTQVCNRCKRVVSRISKSNEERTRQVCSYLIMQKDCCQFSPMNNLLTQRGCDRNEMEHVVRGVNLENTCRRQQRRSAQNDDFLIEKFDGVDFPELSNQKFVYNSTTCQLMEVETCPIASNQTEISDGKMLAIFGGTLCIILLGIVLIYRWCQYDRTRLAENHKTRLQSSFPSGVESPTSQLLQKSPSPMSPLLKNSRENDSIEYNSCPSQ